ncbi:uncharacterized protein LOC119637756 [Glossina fuscipes]|uniref:Uncharacterized protein LOC119637756 n=1 Tax=Glossina fuscipes TaxID=7396 RepID=A0A9C6DSA7_9MUSC|nr:uncharacterized protein LOC119637756 [Glossina fuscipes]
MDFEDLLDFFFVRKQFKDDSGMCTSKNNTCQVGQVLQYIPLMLKEIQNVNYNSLERNPSIIIDLKSRIRFQYCLVYGRVIAKGKSTKNVCKYILDDGTTALQINIYRRECELHNLWKLEVELYSLEEHTSFENKTDVLASLKNLLMKSREQLSNFELSLGCKVLVYGKPSINRNYVSIDVNSLIQDSSCIYEIMFKDKLIDWYNKNLLV